MKFLIPAMLVIALITGVGLLAVAMYAHFALGENGTAAGFPGALFIIGAILGAFLFYDLERN